MKKAQEIELDFIVDKLTNSIKNVVTGDSFATEVTILSKAELKKVSKKMVGYLIGPKNLGIQ